MHVSIVKIVIIDHLQATAKVQYNRNGTLPWITSALEALSVLRPCLWSFPPFDGLTQPGSVARPSQQGTRYVRNR